MKKLFGYLFFACLLAWIAGCNLPTQVCIRVSSTATPCVTSPNTVYWLHRDSGLVVLSAFTNLPLQLDSVHYPQFGSASFIPNGDYNATLTGNEIALRSSLNPLGNIVKEGDADMGIMIVKSGAGAKVISAEVTGCQVEYVALHGRNWQINETSFPNGVTISTTLVSTTNSDGSVSHLYTRDISATPDKGTIVVLIDNFKPSIRQSCCDANARGCCSEQGGEGGGESPPKTFTGEDMPQGDTYNQEEIFALSATCISLSCQYLRIANCATGEIHCYDTQLCPTYMWLGNCASGNCTAGSIYSNGCGNPGYITRCSGDDIAALHP